MFTVNCSGTTCWVTSADRGRACALVGWDGCEVRLFVTRVPVCPVNVNTTDATTGATVYVPRVPREHIKAPGG